ncbi:MAG TPA: hypothetical protein V6C97_27105 [Oculatellaceae cyanobacterium]
MITDSEKQAYIDRIDKKALDENLPLKLAAKKLGLKDWRYWKYKNELKRDPTSKPVITPDMIRPDSIELTITIRREAMDILKARADKYALRPDIIAQIILHDAIMKNGQQNGQ